MVTTRRANGITKPSSASSASASPASSSPHSRTTPSKTAPKTSNNGDDNTTTTTPTSNYPLTALNPIPAPTHTPYLPTRTELTLLTLYPLTLLLGSLFALISPSLRFPLNTSTYSTLHQSFQPASSAPSYFAQKRNIFNVYFVKFGWAWCTAAFFGFHGLVTRGRGAWRSRGGEGGAAVVGKEKGAGDGGTTSAVGTGKDAATTKTVQWSKEAGLQWRAERDDSDARLRRSYQAFFRWCLCTAFWVMTTQWFFGPALVDRGFSLSGGVCQMAEHEAQKVAEDGGESGRRAELGAVLTHAACKAVGGRWAGGYDISGHVFILILGSGMLWLEMLPFLLPDLKGLGIGRVVRLASTSQPHSSGARRDARVATELGAAGHELYRPPSLMVDKTREPVKWTLKAYAMTGALGVAGLSWWMLLMTAAFFHEWVEKVTAMVLAFAGLWVVYLLPRGWPGYRGVVGMPGV